jgi:hypothetical protein
MYTYNQRYDKNKYVWKVKPVYNDKPVYNQYLLGIKDVDYHIMLNLLIYIYKIIYIYI